MSLKEILQELSPPLREFIFQRVANIEDKDLVSLVHVFEPFPGCSRKASHPDEEDWYILPEHLANLAGSRSKPLAEGMRMITWQTIVFEEAKARGLASPQFWSKEEIDLDRPKFLKNLSKFTDAPTNANEFFDTHQDDQFNNEELEDAEDDETDLSCIDEALEPEEIPLSNEEIEERLYGVSEEEEEE